MIATLFNALFNGGKSRLPVVGNDRNADLRIEETVPELGELRLLLAVAVAGLEAAVAVGPAVRQLLNLKQQQLEPFP